MKSFEEDTKFDNAMVAMLWLLCAAIALALVLGTIGAITNWGSCG